ncbi:MAG: hypothetical protein R2739_05520 [Chitinophagales bacterium]|nr:hypothetical protein [Bacteroidota bacterium]
MQNLMIFLDAPSPIFLAIPFLLIIVVVAIAILGIVMLISYLKKRKNNTK